jgi:hypothetical protein
MNRWQVTFDYSDQDEGTTYPSLSPLQREIYEASFCTELTKVENWFAHANWWKLVSERPARFVELPETYLPRRGTFDGPFPDLQVTTSSEYKLSESLIPAFLGHRGKMLFPARRAAVNEGAIAHELVHVFFPNSNRMLAEGLAVYIQSKIGGNLAFPTFEKTLDQMVREFTSSSTQTRLDLIHLSALDKVSTPSLLTLRIGPTIYDDSQVTYALAGSFVGFLIETRGTDLFHRLYTRTPLVPFERDAGGADRWQDVYGISLEDLEAEWKAKIANVSCPP